MRLRAAPVPIYACNLCVQSVEPPKKPGPTTLNADGSEYKPTMAETAASHGGGFLGA